MVQTINPCSLCRIYRKSSSWWMHSRSWRIFPNTSLILDQNRRGHYGRVSHSKWYDSDKNCFDNVQIFNILFFLSDRLVDDSMKESWSCTSSENRFELDRVSRDLPLGAPLVPIPKQSLAFRVRHNGSKLFRHIFQVFDATTWKNKNPLVCSSLITRIFQEVKLLKNEAEGFVLQCQKNVTEVCHIFLTLQKHYVIAAAQ